MKILMMTNVKTSDNEDEGGEEGGDDGCEGPVKVKKHLSSPRWILTTLPF